MVVMTQCAVCCNPIEHPANRRRSRPRVICDRRECMIEANRYGAQRLVLAMARRRAEAPPKTEHTCAQCGETYPWGTEHFYVDRRDRETGEIIKLSRWCKGCKRAYQRARKDGETAREHARRKRERERERLQSDPEFAAKRRAQWRANGARYRETHREAYREAQRRYHERVKADPVRHARQLEAARMNYRLRREREGHPLSQREQHVHAAENGAGPMLPSAPFAEFLYGLGESLASTCLTVGIDPRQALAWKSGEWETVSLAVVDRVLTRAGKFVWEVWPEDEYPEVHEALFA